MLMNAIAITAKNGQHLNGRRPIMEKVRVTTRQVRQWVIRYEVDSKFSKSKYRYVYKDSRRAAAKSLAFMMALDEFPYGPNYDEPDPNAAYDPEFYEQKNKFWTAWKQHLEEILAGKVKGLEMLTDGYWHSQAEVNNENTLV
jgi:hypothetical protein